MQELLLGMLLFFSSLFGGVDSPTTVEPEATETDVFVYPDVVGARVVRVIDGDTIDVAIDGAIERVRYIGIDTPEPYGGGEPECYSNEASNANRELVEEKRVRLEADEERRDDYGRMLRYVYVEDIFVNEALLRDGYATLLFIPPNTREYSNFKNIRDAARASGAGLWSACT